VSVLLLLSKCSFVPAANDTGEPPLSNGSNGGGYTEGRHMETVSNVLMYCVVFGALIVLFGTLVGIALWLLKAAWQTAARLR